MLFGCLIIGAKHIRFGMLFGYLIISAKHIRSGMLFGYLIIGAKHIRCGMPFGAHCRVPFGNAGIFYMIKTLQKKFIVTAMAAISILLVVLIGGINIANCWMNNSQTNQRLEMLADTEGHIDTDARIDMEGHIDTDGHMYKQKKPEFRQGGFFDRPIDEDTAMSLRFFVVRLDNENQVTAKDVSRIFSVGGDEAEQYARRALEKGKQTGYLGGFKYRILAVDNQTDSAGSSETVIVFLDISNQFHSMLMVLVLSVIIAAVCWLCMLLLVILLSRRAILPIAQNIQKQKQFVTDAGHEIKTPLAIIQANIDAMELINGENKWSKNIRSQTMRLSGLMQNLLTLAKMEEGNQELPMADFSISGLSEESLQPFYESAALRGILIETDIQPEVYIHANREYIQRLLSILFDNAVKYTNSGGTITVSLQKTDKISLQVKNTCGELPQQSADKLFDRFSRGDSARTQKSGGYGIGLSAAQAIVAAQKGSIAAKYLDAHTILFVVKL